MSVCRPRHSREPERANGPWSAHQLRGERCRGRRRRRQEERGRASRRWRSPPRSSPAAGLPARRRPSPRRAAASRIAVPQGPVEARRPRRPSYARQGERAGVERAGYQVRSTAPPSRSRTGSAPGTLTGWAPTIRARRHRAAAGGCSPFRAHCCSSGRVAPRRPRGALQESIGPTVAVPARPARAAGGAARPLNGGEAVPSGVRRGATSAPAVPLDRCRRRWSRLHPNRRREKGGEAQLVRAGRRLPVGERRSLRPSTRHRRRQVRSGLQAWRPDWVTLDGAVRPRRTDSAAPWARDRGGAGRHHGSRFPASGTNAGGDGQRERHRRCRCRRQHRPPPAGRAP